MTFHLRTSIPQVAAKLSDRFNTAQHYALVMQRLRLSYPERQSLLHYNSPFQLLIAAILLAQSTEAEVNNATQALFAAFPTPQTFASAQRRTLEDMLHPIGFARQKAKYLLLTSQIILTEYDGNVPRDLLTLTKLPGVARKTANFILVELTGRAEGILVDMNVRRVAERLELAQAKSVEAIENQLMSLAPRSDWIMLSRLFDQHAQAVCTIHRPRCGQCPLQTLCPSALSET